MKRLELKEIQIEHKQRKTIINLGETQYILWLTSPPMHLDYARREKKINILAFFLFFPPTCQKLASIFFFFGRVSV